MTTEEKIKAYRASAKDDVKAGLAAKDAEIARLREALKKSLDRLKEFDVAMGVSVAMAQEVYRHHKAEIEITLAYKAGKGEE